MDDVVGRGGDGGVADDVVGLVLGTEDATPLEFWVGVAPGAWLQLDDVVAASRTLPDGREIDVYGVVAQVRARHEGPRFDSDVFLVADGILPAEVAESAMVQLTRVEPEVFVPPLPGTEVRRATGTERARALSFDGMERRLPAGLSRDGEPVYLDVDFLDGTKGAHVNISGVSGVATKTSYATFLLYGLFHSGVLGAEAHNTKALVFNVKGEDLLFLDHPNQRLEAEQAARYAELGLPTSAFESLGVWAPPRRGDPSAAPDVASRVLGVRSYCWSIFDFCAQELLPFLFADAEDDRQQYTMVVHNVTAELRRAAVTSGDQVAGTVTLDGVVVRDFVGLVRAIEDRVLSADGDLGPWAGRAIGAGTVNAFIRRLAGAVRHVEHLVRADVAHPAAHAVGFEEQVTVVDIHNLNDRAKRFVVGVILRKAFDAKERSGQARPLQFVVLDELNKYAPRDGSSPIKELLLDVAERGRSLGIVLIGCQQTASEVERRVIANSAIRVVGRLDGAEAGRNEYGFLPQMQRQRATLLKPGSMFVSQPGLPVPLLLEFPFPAWATRSAEASPATNPAALAAALPDDPLAGLPAMRFLHTADWHVGRLMRGRSRAEEHEAVLAELAAIAAASEVDAVLVCGDLFDRAAPSPESERIVYRGLLGLAATGATVVVLAGNHDSDRRLQAVQPLLALGNVVVRPTFAGPEEAVIEVPARDGSASMLVAALPFLSQRFVVRADQLMRGEAADASSTYEARYRQLLDWLSGVFRSDTVNVVAAHAFVKGALDAGSERAAHLVEAYGVSATAFPASCHYVALGHLHRPQVVPGPCPIRYPGSPLQLDFGEAGERKVALVVDAAPGRPAIVTEVPLTSGRPLVELAGTLAELAGATVADDAYLKVRVREKHRAGLADEVRVLFPGAVDVVVESPDAEERARRVVTSREGRSPSELFAGYLADAGVDDPRLGVLFDELLEEVASP